MLFDGGWGLGCLEQSKMEDTRSYGGGGNYQNCPPCLAP